MANRWKGNFVVATAATSSGTNYTGRADGSWGLNSQLQQKQGSLWSAGIGAPSIPTGITTQAGNAQVTVSFTPSTLNGGGAITTYTVTSTPSGITATGSTSPITVTGLTNGTPYTFTVTATNTLGYTSAESSPSSATIPQATAIAMEATGTPFIHMYPWASGFGTKYADPSILPLNVRTSLYQDTFSFNGASDIAMMGNAPYISAYPVVSTGFGTKYATPSTALTSTGGLAYSPNGQAIVMGAAGATPPVVAYTWTSGSGFGTKYANPSTPPTSLLESVSFNPTSSVVFLGSDIAASSAFYILAYAWSSASGFGTKFAQPATNPSNTARFSVTTPSGDAIYMGNNNVTFVQGYPWSGSGFGTQYTAPSTPPTGAGNGGSINAAGNALVLAHETTPFVTAYSISNGFGSKFANPATLPTGNGLSASFNKTGDSVVIGHLTTPFASVYAWSAGFGTKYANPSTMISTAQMLCAKFSQ